MRADSAETSSAATGAPKDPISRALGHPVAYVATAVILLAVFAWPFLSDAARVAPTKDPAFYTWRTEAFLTEDPATLLGIEGPQGMFAAGYRVTAPILGGLLRHVAGIGSLHVTVFLMVSLPVLIALALAGFAHSRFRDPLVWHSTAIGSAGLLLTPPFVGYLDNVLCLFFLAASLFFIEGAQRSWVDRALFFVLLLLAGLTHPTTLVIFVATLGLMAGLKLLLSKFDIKATLVSDGWMLATGAASVVATVAIWTFGLWGPSVSLTEAALPPPYGASFFIDRMMLWIGTMRPVLNGPLFLVGLVGLLAGGRELLASTHVRAILSWLAPLAGLFGFIAGLTYPYYRFFNTTLSWVLLVGIGGGFAARFFLSGGRTGAARVAMSLGAVAVGVILVTNITHGLDVSGWTKVKNQWLEPEARADLDELRQALALEDPDRPVVFVIDDELPEPFQIYGASKLYGNTSRYGLPPGQIDRGYLYLGSIENLIAGEPTSTGDETYDPLSTALLEDTTQGIQRSGLDPVIVIAKIFNPAGANAQVAAGEEDLPESVTSQLTSQVGVGRSVWTLHDGSIYEWTDAGRVGLERSGLQPEDPNAIVNLLQVLFGLVLIALPGLAWYLWSNDDRATPRALALVPAVGMGVVTLGGVVVVAIARAPFSAPVAFATIAVGLVLAVAMRFLPRHEVA
ncbi:MAG TPA: hypothetical protein VNP73_08305 [Actinomycetota bacterium]|nr:hypothetical protein [Actinomycetota bacterium]